MNKLINIINTSPNKSIQSSSLKTNLEESMKYSLNAGDKRIRPVTLLSTLRMFNKDHQQGLNSALASEVIHTYSLIHDDLPAMDNDDYRRGRLTNHKVYGERKAILAGDTLLTKAFELVSNDTTIEDSVKVSIIKRLSKVSGHWGMVGGQALDIESEEKSTRLETLESTHETKTGALPNSSVMTAVDIAQIEQNTAKNLDESNHHSGMMFQTKDNSLNVYGDESKFGKKVGSDIVNHKSIYVSLLGEEGAEGKLSNHQYLAMNCLNQISDQYDTSESSDIVDLFYNRDH